MPALFEQVGKRTANYIRARKPIETETGLSFDDPVVEELAKSFFAVAAKQHEGSFKPQREKDILTAGLGNPEHPGHVRGISSKEGWKEGLGPQWEGIYKKRDRYKEAMADYFKEEAKKDFKDMMTQMLSNPPPELIQQLVSAMSVQQMTTQAPQMQLVPTTQPLGTQYPCRAASMANKVCYPIDDIDRPAPCTLVIRYGMNNIHTREVATGFAILGRQYHGRDIPEDYCRVEVSTVVQVYEDDMLEILGPEGIEKLGQAINNFIIWHRRDVQLSEPPPFSLALPLT